MINNELAISCLKYGPTWVVYNNVKNLQEILTYYKESNIYKIIYETKIVSLNSISVSGRVFTWSREVLALNVHRGTEYCN
jgi:hypothetical protein